MFRLLRRYLSFWPTEVGRVYRLLEMVGEGCPGHGFSVAEIGFRWNRDDLAWSRPGLLLLSNLAGPVQHFRAAILDAWRNRVAADLCGREGFRGRPLLDVHGSLILVMFEKEIRLCFVTSWLVVSGTVFSLKRLGGILLFAGSVVLLMVMGTSFGNVPFLLSLRLVKVLSFMIL